MVLSLFLVCHEYLQCNLDNPVNLVRKSSTIYLNSSTIFLNATLAWAKQGVMLLSKGGLDMRHKQLIILICDFMESKRITSYSI